MKQNNIIDSNKVNALLKLYEFRREALSKRRDIEWKVFLSYITGISILTYFIIDKCIYISLCNLIIFPLLIVFFFILWLWNIQRSAHYDHELIDAYKTEINNILDVSSATKSIQNKSVKWIWFISQLMIIVIYTILCVTLIIGRCALTSHSS